MYGSTLACRVLFTRPVPRNLFRVFSLVAALLAFLPAASAQRQPPVDCTTGLPIATSPGHPIAALPIPHNAENGSFEYFCTITTTLHPDGSEDVEIQQPVVDQPSFTYTPIVLRPGDQITVTADGCVQRAGLGQTWERYVNPASAGPPFNSFNTTEQMYFGTIDIQGAMQSGPHGVPISNLPLSRLLTSGFNNVINVPQLSALGDKLTPPRLTLGYLDDNYTDNGGNGYWLPDGGAGNTCQDTANNFRDDPLTTGSFTQPPNNLYGGNAWINFHIVHNAAMPAGAAVPFDFDIVYQDFDLNGFSLNPIWGWQLLTAQNPSAFSAAQPTASLAQLFASDFAWPVSLSSGPMPSTFMPFSSQIPSIDTYHGGLAGLCNWEAWRVDEIETGHFNYTEATFDGIISGGADHSQWLVGDDDISIVLDPSSSMRQYNPPIFNAPFTTGVSSTLEGEMMYSRTFGAHDIPLTPFWAQLNNAVPNAPYSGDGNTAGVLDGHRAIMIGLLGLDNVHPPSYGEIHPIHALAIQETLATNQQADDKWAIMVRRQGNEGSCSDMIHDAGTSRFIVEIMPPPQFADPKTGLPNPGVTASLKSSNLNSNNLTEDEALSFVTAQTIAPGGNQFQFFPATTTNGAVLVLTVADPTPQQAQIEGPAVNANLILGEVELQWSGPQTVGTSCVGNICTSGQPITASSAPHPDTDEPETTYNTLWSSLSHGQQSDTANAFNDLHSPTHAILIQQLQPTILTTRPTAPNAPPKHTVIADPNAQARQTIGMQALCAGTLGTAGTSAAAASFRTFCAEQPPVTSLRLSTSASAVKPPVADINGWLTAPVYVLPIGHSISGAALQSTTMLIKPQAAAAQAVTYSYGSPMISAAANQATQVVNPAANQIIANAGVVQNGLAPAAPAPAPHEVHKIDERAVETPNLPPAATAAAPSAAQMPPAGTLTLARGSQMPPPGAIATGPGPQLLSIGPNEVLFTTTDTKGKSETTNVRALNVAPEVSFISTDTVTQGNWITAHGAVYGNDGQAVINSHFSPPSYVLPAAKNNGASTWSQNPAQDPRALNTDTSTERIAATWYANNSFQVALPVTDGQHHKFSVYCVDWDSNVRNQTLQMLDTATGAVLDTRTITNFHNGIWLSWTISGNVTLNVINNTPGVQNAVVSGLFFDPLPPDGTPPVISLTMPTAGAGYVARGTEGISLTPAFSVASAVGVASVTMTIDGDAVTNGTPETIAPGNHTFNVVAVDNWGVQSTSIGSFTVTLRIRR